ncbi:MAG: hypothetical protein HWE10_00800 [Gammaproteobacteria bacterium]|nr:hypothetical protein [Gammaproteobacteria bacterium]
MNRNFHFKDDDYSASRGSRRHQFNAEYSGEFEGKAKKKNVKKRRESKNRDYF